MFVRMWAFITRQQLVWLKDDNGQLTLSIAKESPFGGLVSTRYWPWWDIGFVELNDDGSVSGVSYVKKWTYYKKPNKNE